MDKISQFIHSDVGVATGYILMLAVVLSLFVYVVVRIIINTKKYSKFRKQVNIGDEVIVSFYNSGAYEGKINNIVNDKVTVTMELDMRYIYPKEKGK